MKIVYVSGPISHPDQWGRFMNIVEGLKVARDINTYPGLSAHCPHGSTFMMDGADIPWDKFLEGDLALLARLDGIVMLPRWRESRGAVKEHDAAHSMGKPVFYWPLDRPALMRWADVGAAYVMREVGTGREPPRDGEEFEFIKVGPVS